MLKKVSAKLTQAGLVACCLLLLVWAVSTFTPTNSHAEEHRQLTDRAEVPPNRFSTQVSKMYAIETIDCYLRAVHH